MGTHPIFESDFDCLTVHSVRPEETIFNSITMKKHHVILQQC